MGIRSRPPGVTKLLKQFVEEETFDSALELIRLIRPRTIGDLIREYFDLDSFTVDQFDRLSDAFSHVEWERSTAEALEAA